MHRILFYSCLIFLLYLAILPAHPASMFTDPDTGWHLAAGDAIRALGAVPEHDLWSFTAGSTRWINLAWLYDVGLSIGYQHLGWHGLIAINSILLSGLVALIFAACIARSGHSYSAFLIAAMTAACMLQVNVRAYQVSYLLIALLALLLAQVARGHCSRRWLMAVPFIMLLWANSHGGFLVGFFLLGVYGLEAIIQKDRPLICWLLATGLASLVACLLTPYGLDIIPGTLGILFSVANGTIAEWQPLSFSPKYFTFFLYLTVFFILVALHPVRATRAEKIIAITWLVMGLGSMRNLEIFAILSAPLLASGLHNEMLRKPTKLPPAIENAAAALERFSHTRAAAFSALALAVLLAAALYTPAAAGLYQTQNLSPLPDVSGEVDFLESHYPGARILNHFDLGGPLIFSARGKVPVFVDGRTEGAYSKALLRDYLAFHNADAGWANILDRYNIGGVMIPLTEDAMLDRFAHRTGWSLAYAGKTAAIFMRDKKAY